MQINGKPKAFLRSDALDFIDLYKSLGERAENFLPNNVVDKLANFVKICFDEPIDPAKQQAEIDKAILELKEAIPSYADISLMIYPHESSKAFAFSAKRNLFKEKIHFLQDNELVDEPTKKQLNNILNLHDYSIGTPPVTQEDVDYMFKNILGDKVTELRKFRDVIGINGDIEEAQWNYFMDVLDQMVIQSTHYTTKAEKDNFLDRTESTINFKGLNGFIRTLVSGTAQTAIELIKGEVFNANDVKVIEFTEEESLFEEVSNDFTSVFAVKLRNMRKNVFNSFRWYNVLSRLVFIDDSDESRSTNTSLVFCFHNGIINALNKIHTKKLGALANTQTNLRLIFDKVNTENLITFRNATAAKIKDYEEELNELKIEQIGETNNPDKDIVLFKFDDFSKQIIKDKYTLSKLHDFIDLVIKIKDPKIHNELNTKLINEFELRTKKYFYSNADEVKIATVVEGGGRNQIRMYGSYLRHRKLQAVDKKVIENCRTIIDIIPNNYQRTLKNHFHKNFGINLFLEKYKEFLTKQENEADNKGRFQNFLIDLGIFQAYQERNDSEKNIIKAFISDLANLEKTSISDDVQMIIRDLVSHEAWEPMPYILFNEQLSWEYKDLFPTDRFDINPFDLNVDIKPDGHIDFDRLLHILSRIKNTFQLFDHSGSLWDRFCSNLTIIINDPSNPSGYSDFNNTSLIKFLKFISNSKITLLLDEAYSDAIKIDNPETPKWRSISRYIFNNFNAYSKISIVSSLSTTKNLGATGNRLGSVIASPVREDVIDFIKNKYTFDRGNTNSLFMLVNTLESAQTAKKVKDKMEAELPKNASRSSIKKSIEEFIKTEIYANTLLQNGEKKSKYNRISLFEGSPLHIFLLDELVSLDKLDVLELPDDFKYKNEAFFSYYKDYLVKALNKFRVNRNFRTEANKRLILAKKIAEKVINEKYTDIVKIIESNGSYLFNIQIKNLFSFFDLEDFVSQLAIQRGIVAIPYKTGFVRFSLGGYLKGDKKSYQEFEKEFETALSLFLSYWKEFVETKQQNKDKSTSEILKLIFRYKNDNEYIQKLVSDFDAVKNQQRETLDSLRISKIKTLYHSFPQDCGVSINSIGRSKNSVFEFYENIGQCQNVTDFIRSKAFTKIYENLLPQIYRNIPLIKNLDINTVISKYGKTLILKYIQNKLNFQPNSYIIDNPEERLIMMEILIELEKILFSDAKVKMLALNATPTTKLKKLSDTVVLDRSQLEGVNAILRKHIKELLLHFNLPFAKEAAMPTKTELLEHSIEKFVEILHIPLSELDLAKFAHYLFDNLQKAKIFEDSSFARSLLGKLKNLFEKEVFGDKNIINSIKKLYLFNESSQFIKKIIERFEVLYKQTLAVKEGEARMITETFISANLENDFYLIVNQIISSSEYKIQETELRNEVRKVVLFLIETINLSKGTDYYIRYTHSLMRIVESNFARQNSSYNEMVQHGYSIHKDFVHKNNLVEHNGGALKWLNDIMTSCGVIATEQPVQTHTRIATDAKKREYPFHRADRTESEDFYFEQGNQSQNEYIKQLKTRPTADFFAKRMAKFSQNMDINDYRCKITKRGLFKELYIMQKSYIKYLTDNFRLVGADEISLEDAIKFEPDVVLFLGAPEKVISFPQIGYFDLNGPNNKKIKTIVTPLKPEADYFGDVKKPRLSMINEKVKEMGGIPVHGSLYAVEEEDGSVFVVQISGDSGVGKSEMLAAMMLKWLKNNLKGIRSIKLIAGDMFHIFPDKEGNLFGIGTEIGDFSRVTDFDPDYIKYYNSLFESSADSNVEDLNSRSTISGLCDISMPFKIDIMLTAHNYSRNEAGIQRFDNPENFILYRDSHGERKEKATSEDGPNFLRTLLRYTSEPNITEIIDNHGNYLDDILSWELDSTTKLHYLCSSFKMIDKIDIEKVVNKIFIDKHFEENKIKYRITKVNFDIIKNRFIAKGINGEKIAEMLIDRKVFSNNYNSLASTPAGQPFIAESGQLKSTKYFIDALKNGRDANSKAQNIQFGILSTDIGKKGKEISGPQKASEDMRKLIQEVRISNPEINRNRQMVRQLINNSYGKLMSNDKTSNELWRYNFFLWQIHKMKHTKLVRFDDAEVEIDLSGIHAEGFDYNTPFTPLLVTPNINIELSGFTETYSQLMSLPNNKEFANEFYESAQSLFIAEGYSHETIVNNIVMQLLLTNGYLNVEDINRGQITEKVNRETLAAARFAAEKILSENKNISGKKLNQAAERQEDELKKASTEKKNKK